ncbi:TBC domain protein, putative [Plasmodium chabaudi chabaudi]|uniref:TBC domain protein, putative n=1 Tax=Plasmodium chabaudi chabaudi TaxID=31271 RepID=A0A1D3S340_PLACU|nr:TBC domain protein, putative [Plasmodium chabaudi chabaudi]
MEYKLEFLSYLLILKKKNEKIAKYDNLIKICINIFEKSVIDGNDLIYLFEKNILDINPSIRSMCWKLALNHLSLNTKTWNQELIEKRKLYEYYIKYFVTDPQKNKNKNKNFNTNKSIEKVDTVCNDDNESNDDFLDSELFSQINKDTFRTRPELSFFSLNPQHTINNNINILNSLINIEDYEDENEEVPLLVNISNGGVDKPVCGDNNITLEPKDKIYTDASKEKLQNINYCLENKEKDNLGNINDYSTENEKKNNMKEIKEQNSNGYPNVCDIVNPKKHYDRLCRILYIYAKLHPYVKYVQGMNEILAPLYYTIFNDPLCNCLLQGEADIFFCFIELMHRQKDVFCEGLDNTDNGINGKLKKFSLLLKFKEYELWEKLYTLKIETQYYAFKWILLLLTQEFDIADTIVLYDQFIINNNEHFILYICLVICMKLKNTLLCGNFTVNLKLLQNIPPFDPYDLICEAKKIMKNDYKNKQFITDIYDSYICEKKKTKPLDSIESSNTYEYKTTI